MLEFFLMLVVLAILVKITIPGDPYYKVKWVKVDGVLFNNVRVDYIRGLPFNSCLKMWAEKKGLYGEILYYKATLKGKV